MLYGFRNDFHPAADALLSGCSLIVCTVSLALIKLSDIDQIKQNEPSRTDIFPLPVLHQASVCIVLCLLILIAPLHCLLYAFTSMLFPFHLTVLLHIHMPLTIRISGLPYTDIDGDFLASGLWLLLSIICLYG